MNSKNISFQLFLGLILFFSTVSVAQEGPSSFDVQLIPKSPGVAELPKFGDVPINKYNGTANINLELYNLAFEGIQLPLNLSYNTSGVRVNQEASWVGLGWGFFENIVVTREVNGFDDLRNIYLNNGGTEDAESVGWIYSQEFITNSGHPTYKFEMTQEDYNTLLYSYQSNAPQDTEPDLFTANLPTGTVEFFLPKIQDNQQVLTAKVISEKNFIVYYDVLNQSFEVIDPNGMTYRFGDKEYSTGFNSADAPTAINDSTALKGVSYFHTNQTRKLNSAWKISNITSYSGRELNFNYQEGFFFSFPHYSEKYSLGIGAPYDSPINNTVNISSPFVSASLTGFHKLYLSEITGDFGRIDFYLSNREDLFSKEAKSRFTGEPNWDPAISPNTTVMRKLDSVQIRNSENALIKNIVFSYSYFNSHKINDPYKERYLRLKLDSVAIADQNHQFNYIDPNNLPPKDSKAVDFWGYYNGVSNGLRIPSNNRFYYTLSSGNSNRGFERFFKFSGATRKSNNDYGRVGNLFSITYPTKGRTEFTYEGNSVTLKAPSYSPSYYPDDLHFQHSGITSSEEYNFRYQSLKLANDPNYSFFQNNSCSVETSADIGLNGIFTISDADLCDSQPTNFQVEAILYCNTGCGQGVNPVGKAVWVEEVNTGAEIILFSYDGHFTQNNGSVSLQKEVLLNPGTYRLKFANWTVNDPFLVVATATAIGRYRYNTAQGSAGFEEFEVGGSRLKKVTNFGIDGSFISAKEYSYLMPFPDSLYKSSGKLMDDLIYTSRGANFHEYTPEVYGTDGGNNVYVHSDNMIRTAASVSGSHVGYSMVTEKNVNFIGESIGSVNTSFINEANEYFTRYIGNTVVFLGADSSENVSYGDVYILGLSPLTSSQNGSSLNEKVYSETGKLLKATTNSYTSFDGAYPPFVYYPKMLWTGNVFSTTYPYKQMYYMDHMNQRNIPRLESSEVIEYLDEKEVITSIQHFYENSMHYRTTKTSTVDSEGNTLISRSYYPQDLPNQPFMSQLLTENRILPVRKENYIVTGSGTSEMLLSRQDTYFESTTNSSQMLLPSEIVSQKGEISAEGKNLKYEKYDIYGNLIQYRLNDGAPISVIWSYNGLYPVSEVVNATFADVAAALGVLEEDLANLQSSDLNNLSGLENLRVLLPAASVTTYKYKPLVGITEINDSRGEKTYFFYDSNNRLDLVKDKDGNILKEHKYNFKTN